MYHLFDTLSDQQLEKMLAQKTAELTQLQKQALTYKQGGLPDPIIREIKRISADIDILNSKIKERKPGSGSFIQRIKNKSVFIKAMLLVTILGVISDASGAFSVIKNVISPKYPSDPLKITFYTPNKCGNGHLLAHNFNPPSSIDSDQMRSLIMYDEEKFITPDPPPSYEEDPPISTGQDRFKIMMTISNTSGTNNRVYLPNAFDISIEELSVPLQDRMDISGMGCGAGGIIHAPETGVDLDAKNQAIIYPDFDYYSLENQEEENFTITTRCNTPGAYRININIPFRYGGVEDSFITSSHVNIICPESFTRIFYAPNYDEDPNIYYLYKSALIFWDFSEADYDVVDCKPQRNHPNVEECVQN